MYDGRFIDNVRADARFFMLTTAARHASVFLPVRVNSRMGCKASAETLAGFLFGTTRIFLVDFWGVMWLNGFGAEAGRLERL